MGKQGMNFGGPDNVNADTANVEVDDIAAALLLRQVEDFLNDGQPRHAIAHIRDVTGVGQSDAEQFVAELKASLFNG